MRYALQAKSFKARHVSDAARYWRKQDNLAGRQKTRCAILAALVLGPDNPWGRVFQFDAPQWVAFSTWHTDDQMQQVLLPLTHPIIACYFMKGFMDKLEDVDDSGVSDDDGNDMQPLQVIVESILAQMSTSALFRLHENWDRLAKLEAVDTGSGCTGSGLDHYTVKTICKVLALEGIILRLAHACLL